MNAPVPPRALAPAPGAVLAVSGLGKEYRLYDSPRQRLKSLLTGGAHHRSHWALRDVNFELHRGQCMGLVGDNGAGKSSLLKLIAGTLQPTTGVVDRIGRVTAILELGAGFHPDFSGRDNLRFGGSLIGIDADGMARLEDEIIAFSELGAAIDRPVKTYSSGMVVRLAFALVTAVEPDVLIIDEALAVGDQHFQKKCVERITQFRENGCTILFCSHSQYHIRQLCNVALWLDGGRIRAMGATDGVLSAYEAHVRSQDQASAAADAGSQVPGQLAGLGALQSADTPPPPPQGSRGAIVAVSIADLGEGDPPMLRSRDLKVTVDASVLEGEQPHIGVMLEQSHGVGITSVATHVDGAAPVSLGNGLWRSTLTFPQLPLHSGQYVVSAYLFDSKGLVVYDQWYQYRHFLFDYPTPTPGLVRLPHSWS
ncbi:ABC transporter ATP-binding protein [Caenimonas sedimenti]|uniref:ABC transporter ATP-binding protein n=1 Tax=Caenimonas sedimenti TaxID=2596921 RepID=UPI003D79C7CF